MKKDQYQYYHPEILEYKEINYSKIFQREIIVLFIHIKNPKTERQVFSTAMLEAKENGVKASKLGENNFHPELYIQSNYLLDENVE